MSAYDNFEVHMTGLDVDARSERIAQLQRELAEMEQARLQRWGMPPRQSRRRERLFLLSALLGLSVWLFVLFVTFR